ncbi:hypothetical protein [Paraburkholderia phytofirmans]|uniref:hypothetical protein n=1 Tax=Paraburkholderia phytofirmans TaxID=261302 RepID=UPI0038B84D94
MMVRPATFTPRPLPRKREAADKRHRLSRAGAVRSLASSDDINGSGLAPAEAIQTDEGQSDSRLATLERITALRLELRQLVQHIAHGADIGLLDVICDEVGSYSRHKAAQEARTWAEQARLSIETGLMQLDRALHPLV